MKNKDKIKYNLYNCFYLATSHRATTSPNDPNIAKTANSPIFGFYNLFLKNQRDEWQSRCSLSELSE